MNFFNSQTKVNIGIGSDIDSDSDNNNENDNDNKIKSNTAQYPADCEVLCNVVDSVTRAKDSRKIKLNRNDDFKWSMFHMVASYGKNKCLSIIPVMGTIYDDNVLYEIEIVGRINFDEFCDKFDLWFNKYRDGDKAYVDFKLLSECTSFESSGQTHSHLGHVNDEYLELLYTTISVEVQYNNLYRPYPSASHSESEYNSNSYRVSHALV